MKRSWLVQRLEKPLTHPSIFGKDNPFSFGGGLKNGGLTDDAMDLIRGIFSFDYMGAAEFEWGAVPKALQSIADAHRSLTAGSFSISLADVAADWRDKGPAPDGEASIYWLAQSADAAEVEARIRSWASEGYRAELKEPLLITTTLRPTEEFHGRTVGWLELDNGFMFFTDREMWEQSCALFGVEIKAVTS